VNDAPAATVQSLRDPDGKLVALGGRLFRVVSGDSAAVRLALTERPAFRASMERGVVAKTWQATDVPAEVSALRLDAAARVLEHELLPFVSYPCEWSPLMLCDAALLTLEMQQLALAEGLILKDAAPTNIVFRGSQPVFVDFLSFDQRESGEYLWRARHQFDACFLLPLLLNREAGIPVAWTLRDFLHGVSHEQAQRIVGIKSYLKPGLIGAIALPAMLSRRVSAMGATHAARDKMGNDARARFALEHQASALHRKLTRLRTRLAAGASRWAAYTANRAHYSASELDAKLEFVQQALAATAPRAVLDLGANTGEFSALAAGAGARVVALDIDEQSVSGIAERARSRQLDIHPLVGNLAQPTPAEGWKNTETRSLLQRLAGHSDLVLVLALMHHLRITGGIPFAEIAALLATLTRRHVVFELVPPTDTMFAAMARGREPLYTDCEPGRAEACLAERFTVKQRKALDNGRVLLLLEKRQA
jgi:ribosomal protein L11 methylase PrmA